MSRRGVPPSFERHLQPLGVVQHVPLPGLVARSGPQLIPANVVENKIALQAAEIEQLVVENERLAATHVNLRQELVLAQREVQRLKEHIRSIQTESDIQIRVLLDKIAKMEAEIRAGESVKKELKQAHVEAEDLAAVRQELNIRVQQATQELQKAHIDAKKLPSMYVELDNLRQEHQRLRATFEYEKGLNMDQLEQMQVMEKNMIGMAREIEKLRAEVLNAEKRVHAPNPYSGTYADGYGRPQTQMGVGSTAEAKFPYGSNDGPLPATGVGGSSLSNAAGDATWGGALGRR